MITTVHCIIDNQSRAGEGISWDKHEFVVSFATFKDNTTCLAAHLPSPYHLFLYAVIWKMDGGLHY